MTEQDNKRRLYKYRHRLNTFKYWPHSDYVSAHEMAYAGFIHDGEAAVCVFCGVRIAEWTIGCDAMSEHKRRSPGCQFITNLVKRPVENLPSRRNKITYPDIETYSVLCCVLCAERERRIIFEPCRHAVCCKRCARLLHKCLICSKTIGKRKKVYLR
ncbi:iap-3 [Sucra jujuba nucleopolyhedrovirus]|uniref:Iap-3 n=1 Tax=Sucra jujuba nucleopolyhedrovirus TaxID=1563660 RepID=A0A097P928_9ABAC|nr:iap-3 [Sucra jujuba nucleopolyhedrovirus]AIU41335.1 iap-3 [Sucra jujuba nucleopolyhedrovirus]